MRGLLQSMGHLLAAHCLRPHCVGIRDAESAGEREKTFRSAVAIRKVRASAHLTAAAKVFSLSPAPPLSLSKLFITGDAGGADWCGDRRELARWCSQGFHYLDKTFWG
ncbi:hypothetical protein DA2_2332, partial [Desulfovibrio sp. A2]